VEISAAADGFGNASSGATVAGVITGSPAQQSGLAAGDVITSLNGQSIADASALTGALEPDKPGDTVTVGWTNASGLAQTASVTLSSGPPQ
jgi:S1-C subfamily serine protease